VSGGLAALLDDIAALAKLTAASIDDVSAAAARAGGKSLGVVVDDTAVTPRYVHGLSPARELPIIKRIAFGSLRNKLVFILPAALILSEFAPWIIPFVLLLGGLYLSYEGAEKVYESVSGHSGAGHEVPVAEQGEQEESTMVRGAIATDFILSTEIMIIALNEVATEPLLTRGFILALVALGITAMVYGVVALIVKMDDIGLHLAERSNQGAQRVGRALVKAMPMVLNVLSTVGIAAMLWVGGHILLGALHDIGWAWPHDQVHHLEELVAHAVPAGGGFLAWLVNTLASAVAGLLVGGIVVAVMHILPFRKKKAAAH